MQGARLRRRRLSEFPTIQFAYFALVVLTISWVLRSNRTVQKVFLLVASYAFAWKFKPLFLAILILSSLMCAGKGAIHSCKPGCVRVGVR